MTKPSRKSATHHHTAAPANPTVKMENVFPGEQGQLGASFQRFQELKKARFAEAVLCFADFKKGLMRRMQWEEETLFPIFDKQLGALSGGISASLCTEHDQIREHLNAIENKLARKSVDTESEEASLEMVLSAHNHREHEVVYPICES